MRRPDAAERADRKAVKAVLEAAEADARTGCNTRLCVAVTRWTNLGRPGLRHYAAIRKALGPETGKTRAAFLRGASWAYGEITGALIVPASFEEQARAELTEPKRRGTYTVFGVRRSRSKGKVGK